MCAASQKESLAGLDSTQTDGVNAIASLEEITGVLGKNGKNANQKTLTDLPYFLEYMTQSVCWRGGGGEGGGVGGAVG